MELEIKKGYKQTDVGLIPEDWEVKRFEEFGRFFKGKGIRKDEVKLEGNPCVRYGELYTRYDNIIKQTYSFINDLTANESIKIKYGDLLFAGSGETREEIGKSAVILRDDTYAGGDIVVFQPNKIDSVFLGFMSNSVPVSKQKSTNGQGDAVVHIYSGGISKVKIPLPPTLAEQKAIATALSDVDDLMRRLDVLIDKKKAIKQGTMQQLLTPPSKGGKRLDGFDGEWVEKSLGELSQMSSGGTPSSKVSEYYDGDINWVSISDMTRAGKYIDSSLKKITESGLLNSSARMFPQNTVLLAMYASIGKCVISKVETTTSQAILGITVSNSLDREFLYYFLIYKREELANQGQQGTQSNLNKAMVQAIRIDLPTISEQKAIAQILSDMDQELEELATKKEKYEYIKQGMMQELLTGKTRLV